MSRTRVRRRRLAAVLMPLAVVAAGPGMHLGGAAQAPPAGSRSYVVRPGDTLWSIATGISGPSADPRPLVYAIERSNRVEPGALVPGQVLVIPLGRGAVSSA